MLLRKITFSVLFLSQVCFSQLKFTDKANELGIDFGFGAGTFGGGVSFCDYNNDGWDDLTISSEFGKPIRFFKNVAGTLVEDTIVVNNSTEETKQIVWVDFDNDGDKDLFFTTESGSINLHKNDGNFNFEDVSSSSGLNGLASATWGASWGDYNNDGYLDIFINFLKFGDTQPNALFKNNGDGTFINVSASAGINQINDPSFCSAFFDYNNDGWQDIYVTNHKYDQSYLYKNNGDGTFSDESVAANADVFADGMSTTIGDYNNDGWQDIYITNSAAGNFHLKNNGDGTFSDVATELGTNFLNVSWGASFLDADNDSFLDLYVSGQKDGTDGLLPSAFYKNNNNIAYIIPNDIGLENDKRRSFSNAIGDIDNNGFPEIFVINENEDNFLWKNETSSSNNWIKIKLEGVHGNKDGVGNKIEISADGKSQYRYTHSGEGYLAQNSSYEFVGVADATMIDYIKITWNTTGVVETITNVTPNQALTIQEEAGIVLNVKETNTTSFSVFPNPSDNGYFTLQGLEEKQIQKVQVFDISGKELSLNSKLLENNQLDLSKNASGVYFIKVTSQQKSSTIKVLKK